MKLFISPHTQNVQNKWYSTETTISSLEELKQAAGRDHIAPKMRNNERGNENFIEADCIMLDMDNTHSNNPADWKTLDDITDTFPDVHFYYIKSRNYMKEKTRTSKDGTVTHYEPREKFHFYFPLSRTITDFNEYEALMLKAAGLFPYFDLGAAKPAQFFFGVPNADGGEEAGDTTLDRFMEQVTAEEIKAAVTDFSEKVNSGEYESGNDETQKAVSRLGGYLGIQLAGPTQQKEYRQQTVEYTEESLTIAKAEQQHSLAWLRNWAEKNEVPLGTTYPINTPNHPAAIGVCTPCPWEEDHTEDTGEKQTVIIIELGGQLNFLCRHSHGWRYGWKEFRKYHEEKMNARKPAPAPEPAEEVKPADGKDYLSNFLDKIQSEAYRPYQTDLTFFDSLLGGGIVPQSLLLLMASPAAGKTSLCQQLAEGMAAHKKPIEYLNLEMSREQMLSKAIASRINQNGLLPYSISALDVLQGYRWNPDLRQMIPAEIEAYRQQIFPFLQYNPDTGNDIDSIKEHLQSIGDKAKSLGQQAPAVVLDYLHLVRSGKEKLEIQDLIKKTVVVLKDYAIRYDTFVIGIVAINRQSKDNITLESGRDSSNIEYTADYILSLDYKEKDADIEKMSEIMTRPKRTMVLRVLKNRFGTAGRAVDLEFRPAEGIFSEWQTAAGTDNPFENSRPRERR